MKKFVKKNKSSKPFMRFLPVLFVIVFFALIISFSAISSPATGNAVSGGTGGGGGGAVADGGGGATTNGGRTVGAGGGFISDLFTQWGEGNLDVNIAKYLFFLMLLGIIWGALNFAMFPPQGFLQFIIALPTAFLATAYITPTEVFTILTSYTALGITLTFIVPFAIMIFVSAMLLSNSKIRQMSIPRIILETFLWVFFLVMLGYKLIAGLVSGQIKMGLTLPIIIMVAIFLITILIVIFHSGFRRGVWKIGLEIRRAQAKAARVEAEEAQYTARSVERARERGGGL